MDATAFAPYPPPHISKAIVSDEWTLCLESWLLLTRNLLSLPDERFILFLKDGPVVSFLYSFVVNSALDTSERSSAAPALALRRQCFLTVHRTLLTTRPVPESLLDVPFLSGLGILYGKSQALPELLERVWQEQHLEVRKSILQSKHSLMHSLLSTTDTTSLDELLKQVVAFVKACSSYARYLLTGSDWIDAIVTGFDGLGSTKLRRKLVILIYACFMGLMRPGKRSLTSLLDILYDLKSASIMKAVVQSTPFLAKFETFVAMDKKHATRARPLIEQFATMKHAPDGRPKRPVKRKVAKGKSKATTDESQSNLMHIHQMSMISQIQDLFPDLGAGFIMKLLEEYDNDTEQVTAHLLDNTLPRGLQTADRAETLPSHLPPVDEYTGDLVPDLAPHSTPPVLPKRRNVYDDDEFDRLSIDTSRLHIGSKNADLSADQLLAAQPLTSQKAAILAALATFDSDDDERDDTYDVADVGGTIDNTMADSDQDVKQDLNEATLFTTYKTNDAVFQRGAETRRSLARRNLKMETGMSDEAIEGWAIMMQRDPKRLQRLERLHAASGGLQQRAMAGSAWKAGSGAEDTEDSDALASENNGRGGSRGRGRGHIGRARFGNVAAPASDLDTQAARQRKDANKSSRANHNRRNQRAKKMARGGGMAG